MSTDTHTLPAVAEMERAFLASDPDYDGVFVTAVKTTGVFCRPSCPARKPLRRNLEFFGSVKDALFAGFRPCRRCRTLEAQLETLGRRLHTPLVPGENTHLRQAKTELDEYFAGRRRAFEVPLHVSGTPFQERVWHELALIPYGATRTYADIARALGAPRAVRAVGQANGRNRIAIVLPCHRVVNVGGKLGGYGGGLWRKQRLLALEQGQALGAATRDNPSSGLDPQPEAGGPGRGGPVSEARSGGRTRP